MDSKLVKDIKLHLSSKSTAELMELLNANDTNEWSNEAFQAMRSLLRERGEAVPEVVPAISVLESKAGATNRSATPTFVNRIKKCMASEKLGALRLGYIIIGIIAAGVLSYERIPNRHIWIYGYFLFPLAFGLLILVLSWLAMIIITPIAFVKNPRGVSEVISAHMNHHSQKPLGRASGGGSIIAAVLWMVLIAILLFWLPVIGPFVAGLVGGKKAGSVGSAIVAVFLPAVLLGIGVFSMSSFFMGLPIVGAILGGSVFILALVGIGPLLVGAIIGGLFA